ncbi:MAG: 30S ribosomal protein S12 methylthiotransferase RimO [Candidatus Aminicenantales bacterium]
MMPRVALVSLGCAKNLVDSEVMLGYLEAQDYTFVSDLNQADVIIVNTCGFIHPARKESSDAIRKAVETKKRARGTRVIVSGCYVERNQKELEKAFPEVDAWVGVRDYDKIVSLVEGQPYTPSEQCFLYDETSPRRISTPPGWAYVKISEGCSHECSFCAIPLIKGPYRSRTIPSIVREVERLVNQGVQEINLVSQDSTYYGRDKGMEDGIVRLLQALVDIPDLGWVRLLYSYPEEVTDALLEIMQEEKICSYLDIPFQHSHPRIIKKMRRGMDGKRALKLLEKIRKRLPDAAVRTSLVVGFPGESRTEFEDLVHFVQEARFDHLGVFTYSLEAGTPSAPLGDPVKRSVKEKRKNKIMEIQAGVAYANNERYLGKKLEVLVEGTLKQDPLSLVGRSRFQAPEVDGIVFIPVSEVRPEVFNSVQLVEITDREVYDLYGRLV